MLIFAGLLAIICATGLMISAIIVSDKDGFWYLFRYSIFFLVIGILSLGVGMKFNDAINHFVFILLLVFLWLYITVNELDDMPMLIVCVTMFIVVGLATFAIMTYKDQTAIDQRIQVREYYYQYEDGLTDSQTKVLNHITSLEMDHGKPDEFRKLAHSYVELSRLYNDSEDNKEKILQLNLETVNNANRIK